MADPLIMAGFLVGCSVYLGAVYLDVKRRGRFSVARSSIEKARTEAAEKTSVLLGATASALAPLVLTVFPEDVRLQTKRRLVQAGLEDMEAEDFLALKLTGMIAAVLVVGLLSVLIGFSPVLAAVAAGPGYVIPEAWLDSRLKRRRKEIERAAPDFAVLLSGVLSAGGVGIEEALKEVAARIGGELGKEVNRTFLEITTGKRKAEALDALAERCGVAEVNEVVRCIRIAERFGTPIAEALRDLAAQVYYLKRARVEERLGRAQIAVIFPMLFFFIFPLLGLIFFPAIIKLGAVLNV